MSTISGWRSAPNYDRVINTKVIPAIAEAYGELVTETQLEPKGRNVIVVETTEKLISILTHECIDNALKKMSDKKLTQCLINFSEDEYNKRKQEILQRQ